MFLPLAVATANPTIYAIGVNNTPGGGLGSFNPRTGVSNHNLGFEDLGVDPQVTADGTKAAYVRQRAGIYSAAVYSVTTGALLGSIPLPSFGVLALSPNSVSAYINGVESGAYHIIEVNLDTLSVVLDVNYSSVSSHDDPQPLAVSPDGATVYTEDPLYLYRLDASTLQATGSSTYTLSGGIFVTPDGEDLFTLAKANGSGEAIEFVSTETLTGTRLVNLPPAFMYHAFTTALKISPDGSTIVVLGPLEPNGMDGSAQPIGILDIASRTFSATAFSGVSYSDIAPSEDGSKVYLGDTTGLISIFDVQSQTVAPAFDVAAPVQTLQLRTNGTLYVGYTLNIEPVVAIDSTTNQVVHTFNLPAGALSGFNILVDAQGTGLYASGRPTVSSTDISAERFGAMPPTGLTYSSLAWASGRSGIWAAGPFSLDLLDPKTLAVTRSIPFQGGNTPPGINALAITPDQTEAVLTYGSHPNTGDGCGVFFVDLATGASTSRLALDAPSYIAFSPDSRYTYIASVRPGTGYPPPYHPVISVVDLSTYAVVRTISIPVAANRVAFSLAVSADGSTLYTTTAGNVFAFDSVSTKLLWTAAPGVETIQVATIPGSTDLLTSDLGSTNLWRLSPTGAVLGSIDVGIPTSYLTVAAN